MAKKKFMNPLILNSEPGDDIFIGGGTGQGSPDLTFENWLLEVNDDYDEDGDIDFDDYRAWWKDMELGEDLWYEVNPDKPYNP